jgi:hypothetical protein
MMKILKDITTGIDGKTYDNVRVYMLIGVCAYLALTGYHLWDDNAFDWIGFASGFGIILAGGSAGLGLKAHTEPGGKKDVDAAD